MTNGVPNIYCTSFCNHGHRMSDGMPVDHECYVLPVPSLIAECDGDIPTAIEVIEKARPLRVSRGVKVAKVRGESQ